MTYKVTFCEDFVFTYFNNKVVGKFEVETFLTNVISPLEFDRYYKNPDKQKFTIRKLEFNNHNLF